MQLSFARPERKCNSNPSSPSLPTALITGVLAETSPDEEQESDPTRRHRSEHVGPALRCRSGPQFSPRLKSSKSKKAPRRKSNRTASPCAPVCPTHRPQGPLVVQKLQQKTSDRRLFSVILWSERRVTAPEFLLGAQRRPEWFASDLP